MAKFYGIVHKDADSEYGVSFPDFPGCVTAGETMEELYDMAREALQGHINAMHADGEQIPEPMTFEQMRTHEFAQDMMIPIQIEVTVPSVARRVNVILSEDLLREIEDVSKNRSEFLTKAARHYMLFCSGNIKTLAPFAMELNSQNQPDPSALAAMRYASETLREIAAGNYVKRTDAPTSGAFRRVRSAKKASEKHS